MHFTLQGIGDVDCVLAGRGAAASALARGAATQRSAMAWRRGRGGGGRGVAWCGGLMGGDWRGGSGAVSAAATCRGAAARRRGRSMARQHLLCAGIIEGVVYCDRRSGRLGKKEEGWGYLYPPFSPGWWLQSGLKGVFSPG
jgi:hypothetical protein